MIVVLVTARREGASEFEQAAVQVWERFMHTRLEEVRCFFVEARTDVTTIVQEGSWLVCPGFEGLRPHMWLKMKKAFQYVLQEHPEVRYIIKTNLSSLWHWDRLIDKLKGLPSERLALGLTFGDDYPSGCGTVYSIDVIEGLLHHASKVTESMYQDWHDDHIMGWLQHTYLGITTCPKATRLDTTEWCDDIDQHYHLRTRDWMHSEPERIEIEVPFMHRVIDQWYGIPKVFYQTWKKELPPQVKGLVDWMRKSNPEYQYRFFDDEKMDTFVRDYGKLVDPRIEIAYNRLLVGAAKADLWRYLVLYLCGGVYLDVDSLVTCPLRDLIKAGDRGIISREGHSGLFVQWMLIFGAGSALLKKCLLQCAENILSKKEGSILELTGPYVFSEVINGNEIWCLDDISASELIGEGIRVYGTDYKGFAVFKHAFSDCLLGYGIEHWTNARKIIRE